MLNELTKELNRIFTRYMCYKITLSTIKNIITDIQDALLDIGVYGDDYLGKSPLLIPNVNFVEYILNATDDEFNGFRLEIKTNTPFQIICNLDTFVCVIETRKL